MRLDTAPGVIGGGQEGALQGALAPVLDGTSRLGEQAQHLAGSSPLIQQAALLGFPQTVTGRWAPCGGRGRDLLSVHAELERAGRTSMTVAVRVTAERWNASGSVTEVATGRLTFVAIDAEGTPRPVPSLDVCGPDVH